MLVAVPNKDGHQFPFTEDQLAWLHLELAQLVVVSTMQFMGHGAWPEGIWLISPVFLVPKKGPKLWQLVINQQQLNLVVPLVQCKFELVGTLAQLVGHNWWGITFNLAQGYHHVKMHTEACPWMGFHVGKEFYHYKVLPFSLKWSPWVFTKIIHVMVHFWWTQGILMFSYIDNFCVVSPTGGAPPPSQLSHCANPQANWAGYTTRQRASGNPPSWSRSSASCWTCDLVKS